jgi:DNA-binding transcriptional MerR regulator
VNVGEVAAAAGVSVRTLHHWDAVGLLVPSGRSAAGYRSYSHGDVDRLAQVMTYRELGFSLEEVKRLLDDPTTDVLGHLRRQQSLLADRIARLQAVAAMVRRALEAKGMGIELEPHEVREVFGDEDPTQWADEALERWGDTDPYRQSHVRTSAYGKDDWLEVKAEARDVEQRFAAAMAGGEPADGAVARGLAEEHRQHITRRFYDCSLEMHRSLSEMYVTDERFTAHYEAVAPGLAQYVHDAVHANADAGGLP